MILTKMLLDTKAIEIFALCMPKKLGFFLILYKFMISGGLIQ